MSNSSPQPNGGISFGGGSAPHPQPQVQPQAQPNFESQPPRQPQPEFRQPVGQPQQSFSIQSFVQWLQTYVNPKDNGSVGWWFLGFLVPQTGLLVWILFHYGFHMPKSSRMVGWGLVFGLIAYVVLIFIYVVVFIGLVSQLHTLGSTTVPNATAFILSSI